MLFKTSGPVVDYFLKVWMLLQFKSGHPQVQVVVCARWTEIPLRQCLRNKCLQDRLQWRIGRGTTQNLLPTPSPKGGTIKPSNVDTNVASTNSPPVSGPACCSAVPGGNWGCCRQPVSASQSNTWRRRWLGRWCWTGAVPGSGAPSHSCRTWNKAQSVNEFQHFPFELRRQATTGVHNCFLFNDWHFDGWKWTPTCPPLWYLWGSDSSRHSTLPGRPRLWRPAEWHREQFASSYTDRYPSQRMSTAFPGTPNTQAISH